MNTEPELSPELWSALPDTIWQIILSFLPFSTLIRFRRVCKTWNKLITTPSFARECVKLRSPKGVPVLSARRDVAGTVYRCLEVDNRVRSPIRPWEKFVLGEGAERCRYLIACHGGLMLFDTDHPDQFVVCNPLTRRCREVECPSKAASSSLSSSPSSVEFALPGSGRVERIAGLVASRDTGNYKLVIVSIGDDHGEETTTSIYDSATRAWAIGIPVSRSSSSSMPGVETYETFLSPGAVTCNSSIYCVLAKYELQQRDDWTWRVAKYDVDSGCWAYTSNLVGRTILFAESTRSGCWPVALPDIQIVSVGDKIIIVSKVRTSIWLPRHHSRSIFYNSFAVLLEHERFMKVLGHHLPRTVVRKLLQAKEGGPYTGLPCTYAGYDGSIYFTHQHEMYDNTEEIEGDARVVRVGMFDVQNPESHQFLPDYLPDEVGLSDSDALESPNDRPVRMKIWVLEPSLIACV